MDSTTQEKQARNRERARVLRSLDQKDRTAGEAYWRKRSAEAQSDAARLAEEASLYRQKEEEAAREEKRKRERKDKMAVVFFTVVKVSCLVVFAGLLWYGGAALISRFLDAVQSFR